MAQKIGVYELPLVAFGKVRTGINSVDTHGPHMSLNGLTIDENSLVFGRITNAARAIGWKIGMKLINKTLNMNHLLRNITLLIIEASAIYAL